MIRRVFFAVITLGLLTTPGEAQVDPEIHKLCVDARDYSGCIKAQQEGQQLLTNQPNACPSGHAYSGAGYCTRVICQSPRGGVFTRMILSADGHDPELAGKGNKCPRTGLISRSGSLRWGTDTVAVSFDPNCPSIALEVGWQSTCQMVSTKTKPTAISNQ